MNYQEQHQSLKKYGFAVNFYEDSQKPLKPKYDELLNAIC